eukprot:3725945-Pyramimonas_sp.AAC.1
MAVERQRREGGWMQEEDAERAEEGDCDDGDDGEEKKKATDEERNKVDDLTQGHGRMMIEIAG